MARTFALLVLASLAFLVACGGGDDEADGGAQRDSVIPENADDPFARPETTGSGPFAGSFEDACRKVKGFGAAQCACMAELADEQLGVAERTFLTAQLGGDKRRAEMLRKKLDGKQMSETGSFMMKATAACRGQR